MVDTLGGYGLTAPAYKINFKREKVISFGVSVDPSTGRSLHNGTRRGSLAEPLTMHPAYPPRQSSACGIVVVERRGFMYVNLWA